MGIKTCPTCGSPKIRRQTIDLEMTVKNRTQIIPGLELEVCPNCGEKLFDREAQQRVEAAFSPVTKRLRKLKKA